MRRALLGLVLVCSLAAVLVQGCDPFGDPSSGEPPPGRVCYQDADCVPDGCCGEATWAVHLQDAPDCGGAVCGGQCAVELIDCGCAVPYCRDGRCAKAVRSTCL